MRCPMYDVTVSPDNTQMNLNDTCPDDVMRSMHAVNLKKDCGEGSQK